MRQKYNWFDSVVMAIIIALALMSISFDTEAGEREDLHCVSLNIYFEARGESLEGQFAVGLVTMNRVLNNTFPDDACSVVWQRSQFSWTHDGKSDRPRDLTAWQRAQKIAAIVYPDYKEVLYDTDGSFDLTRGSTHFYAYKITRPYWADDVDERRRIGGHLFGRML